MSNKASLWALVGLLVVALAATMAWFWFQRGATGLVAPQSAIPQATTASEAVVDAPAVMASAPAILFPVELAASEPPIGTLELDVGKAVFALLGSSAGKQFLQTSDFPRHFVATVDNLGRSHAPPSAWPINPTAGRFLINEGDGKTVINSSNNARYTPLVKMLTTLDIGRATALYVHVYPMLQQAYEDIGYPKRHFNDRFVEVIDQLLQTPDPAEPLQVQLTEVKGPLVSNRPWVRYEFADPGLERLTAGQKIMLRVGSEHRRNLKAQLIKLRNALTSLGRQR